MRWPKDMAVARAIQEETRNKIVIAPIKKMPRHIAGVDAAFNAGQVIAVASVFSYPALEPVEDSHSVEGIQFPYVPGFLAFREGSVIVSAVRKLRTMPDLIMVDGHGIAHPRGVGIASQLGVMLNVISVGCAKSRLVGEYEEPGQAKGDWSNLVMRGVTVGAALRTRYHVKPVFVSPGHRIDLAGSVEIVMKCCGKYRIPEPLRRADMMTKQLKEVCE
jgi:deoxyribonuclease V